MRKKVIKNIIVKILIILVYAKYHTLKSKNSN